MWLPPPLPSSPQIAKSDEGESKWKAAARDLTRGVLTVAISGATALVTHGASLAFEAKAAAVGLPSIGGAVTDMIISSPADKRTEDLVEYFQQLIVDTKSGGWLVPVVVHS